MRQHLRILGIDVAEYKIMMKLSWLLPLIACMLMISWPTAIIQLSDSTRHHILAQDTTWPIISYWNISPSVYRGEPFEVSAYVWDADSGVDNVTVHILNSTHFEWVYELNYNGSHYVATIPALPIGDVYRLHIKAFDKAGNSVTSYIKTVNLLDTRTPIPEDITLPVVVGSSLVFMAIVIVLAVAYSRRHPS